MKTTNTNASTPAYDHSGPAWSSRPFAKRPFHPLRFHIELWTGVKGIKNLHRNRRFFVITSGTQYFLALRTSLLVCLCVFFHRHRYDTALMVAAPLRSSWQDSRITLSSGLCMVLASLASFGETEGPGLPAARFPLEKHEVCEHA